MSDLKERLRNYDGDRATRFKGKTLTEEAAARIEELEASIKWVDEVYPSRIEAGGAGIEMTWAEFSAMQRALGVKVDARIGDQEGRAGHNHKLRVRAQAAEARAETAEAKLATAVEALEDIANQKRTDELETEYDVECADFEGGYDACIDVARAAIRALKSTSQT